MIDRISVIGLVPMSRRGLRRVPALVIAAVLAASCASQHIRDERSPELSAADAQRPLAERVPGPLVTPPPNAPGVAINPVRVSARQANRPASYRTLGPKLKLSIPPFENVPPARSSARGRGLPSPNGTRVPESGGADSWVDSSGGFSSTNFDHNAIYNSGFVFIPPDSHAAAGPLHLVSVVNTTVSFHRKDGTLDFRGSLANFFAPLTPLTFTFDPKVLYDQYSDRWLIVTLEQTSLAAGDAADTSRIFLAVSDDANPNGTWYVSEFNSRIQIGGTWTWADYPGFGVGEDAVYIAANQFPFGPGGANVRLWIVAKGDGSGGFYDGGAASFGLYDPYAGGGFQTTTQPAQMYGTLPGATDTFLAGYSGLSDNVNEYIQVVRVDNPLGAPTFTQSVTSFGNVESLSQGLSDADQLGTSTDIEVNDRRTLNSVWMDNSLWTAFTIRGPGGCPGSCQSTAYWLEIDTSGGGAPTIADQGQIAGEDIATGTATFFPSIAVNGYGDVTIGFSASDNSIYPGAYFATRETGDAAGTIGASQTVAAGTDYYIRTFGGARNRWGDYSATVVDPADGCFWVYNEYAMSRGTPIIGEDGRWATAFARTCNLTHPCSDSTAISAFTWTRFAMPCDTAPDNTVEDVFSGLAPGDYATTWVVFRREASSPPSYVALDLADPMEAGVGYWVYSENATVVNLNGTINALEDIVLYGESPAGRPNYIGHNQDASISWADVRFVDGGDLLTLDEADSAGLISRQMYQWNGAAYQVFNGLAPQVGSLDAFDGFWVRVFEPGIRLRIPQSAAVSVYQPPLAPDGAGTGGEGGMTDAGSGDSPGQRSLSWHVQLVAESGELSDPGNYLGRKPDSVEGSDLHDLIEPRPFGNRYLSVLFTNPALAKTSWGYTSDFRETGGEAGGVWPFVVKASPDVRSVTLTLNGDSMLFQRAWLVDRATGEWFKVLPGERYTFGLKGERHFTFEIEW